MATRVIVHKGTGPNNPSYVATSISVGDARFRIHSHVCCNPDFDERLNASCMSMRAPQVGHQGPPPKIQTAVTAKHRSPEAGSALLSPTRGSQFRLVVSASVRLNDIQIVVDPEVEPFQSVQGSATDIRQLILNTWWY